MQQADICFKKSWCSKKCFCNGFTFVLTTFGMTVVMACYLLAGAYMFRAIEAQHELDTLVADRKLHIEKRNEFINNTTALYQRMTSQGLTPADVENDFRQMLIDYVHNDVMKNNWDGRVADDDEITEKDLIWQLVPSLVFATTTVTTIGYGIIVPKTPLGRGVTIAYAIVGIPCAMVWLSLIGNKLALLIKLIYYRFCLSTCKSKSDFDSQENSRSEENEYRTPYKTNNSSRYDSPTNLPSIEKVSTSGIDPAILVSNLSTHSSDAAIPGINAYLELPTTMPKSNSCTSVDVASPSKDIPKVNFSRVPSAQALKSDTNLRRITSRSVISSLDAEQNFIDIPAYVTVLLLSIYIILGGVMFSQLCESEWDLLVGCYFCFITLSTIGYGDFVFGKNRIAGPWKRNTTPISVEQMALTATYILFGLVVVSMCIQLLQNRIKMVSMRIRICFWSKFKQYNSALRKKKLARLKRKFEKEKKKLHERKKRMGIEMMARIPTGYLTTLHNTKETRISTGYLTTHHNKKETRISTGHDKIETAV